VCILLSYALPVSLAAVLFNLPRILSLFPIGSLLQVEISWHRPFNLGKNKQIFTVLLNVIPVYF
jgi:hypothetical protein